MSNNNETTKSWANVVGQQLQPRPRTQRLLQPHGGRHGGRGQASQGSLPAHGRGEFRSPHATTHGPPGGAQAGYRRGQSVQDRARKDPERNGQPRGARAPGRNYQRRRAFGAPDRNRVQGRNDDLHRDDEDQGERQEGPAPTGGPLPLRGPGERAGCRHGDGFERAGNHRGGGGDCPRHQHQAGVDVDGRGNNGGVTNRQRKEETKMIIWSGRAFDAAFQDIQAKDYLDLFDKLKGNKILQESVTKQNCTMWIEIKRDDGNLFWLNLMSWDPSNQIYDRALPRRPDQKRIKVCIRDKSNSNTPNSSPQGRKNNGTGLTTPLKPSTPVMKKVENEMQTEIEDTRSNVKYVNDIEPITMCAISDFESHELIDLHYRKFVYGKIDSTIIRVSVEGLVNCIKSALNENENILTRPLGEVQFRDADKPPKRYHLNADVWIESILPYSKKLREIFAEQRLIYSMYKEELEALSELGPLFYTVKIWVADMLDGRNKEAQERLLAPMYLPERPSINTHMSPCYFTHNQARYIGNLVCPYYLCKVRFQEWLIDQHERHQTRKSKGLCTSHELAPKIMKIFEIKKNFQDDPEYVRRRTEWMIETEHIEKFYNSKRFLNETPNL